MTFSDHAGNQVGHIAKVLNFHRAAILTGSTNLKEAHAEGKRKTIHGRSGKIFERQI